MNESLLDILPPERARNLLYGDLCLSLSGFFLLMTIVTVVFDVLDIIFVVYKPSSGISKCKECKEKTAEKEPVKEPIKVVIDTETNDLQVDDSVIFDVTETGNVEISTGKSVKIAQYEEEGAKYGFSLLKVLDFNLIIWPGVLLGGIQVAYMYNLTAMMKNF